MSTAALLSFTLVALLTVVSPGLETLLVVRTALLSGRRVALGVVLGSTTGCLVWATAGLLGLSALLATSQLAYDVVRVLGAGYLVYLGVSALWASRRPQKAEESPRVVSFGAAVRVGLLTNLLNPKPGVFYVSLLPQFLPHQAPAWGVLLVAIHLAIGLVWLPMLAWTADRARRILVRDAVKRWMDRVTASVLIGLGVKLAVESR
jgi:threonine/homoserine/homoserine lactone efflux protein